MSKVYNVRVYAMGKSQALVLDDAVSSGMLKLTRRLDGVGRCKGIYDGFIGASGLKLLISLGIKYFPFDHYEDFIIACPNCHERIDDDMILTMYDKWLLRGYNISCNRLQCAYQQADVDFLLDC